MREKERREWIVWIVCLNKEKTRRGKDERIV